MHAFLVACGIRPSLELEAETQDHESPTRFSLRQPFAILGRHPAADVYLDADGVRPRHLYFQAIEGRIGCFNVSQTGSFATENREVETFCWLSPEQTVNIGSSQIKLLGYDEVGVDGVRVLDPLAPGSAWEIFSPRITLEIEGGSDAEPRKTWIVDRVLSLVGSASRCALQLREEGISNVHCSLVLTTSGLWVVDLLGRGGIVINGQQVRVGRLEQGDELKLGSFLIRLQSTDPASLPEAEADWPTISDDEIEDLSDIFPQGRNYQTPWPADAEHAQLLEDLVDQFQEMREPLFDQHQHMLSPMIETYGEMKGDQREALKNELERLCRISKEVELMEQAKRPRELVTKDVAQESGNPPQNGDQLSMSTDAEYQGPETPASKPKSKPRSAASLLKDADTSVFRIPMKTGDLFENAASTEFPALSDSQSWMDGETEPILPNVQQQPADQLHGYDPSSLDGTGSKPPVHYQDLSNSTIHERIDVLHQEQSSIWRKLSNFFFGKSAK